MAITGNYGTPRADLQAAMREYIATEKTWIGTRVFPLTSVKKKAAAYSAITRKTMTARSDTSRAVGSAYMRTHLEAKDKTYACTEYGVEAPLDASERELYKSDFDAELELVQMLTARLLREQEIRIASQLMTETTFDSSAVFAHCSTAWSNPAADIIGDVAAAKNRGFANTGLEFNALVVGRSIFTNLMRNAAIRGAVQYVQSATWDAVSAALAAVLGVRQVLVGGGVYDEYAEGGSASLVPIWGSTYALVAYVPETASLAEPALGRTFIWADDAPENAMVESYDEPQSRSTVFRVRQHTDERLVDKFFGQLIDVTATS